MGWLAPLLADSAVEAPAAEEFEVVFTRADLPWLLGLVVVFAALVAFILVRIYRGASEHYELAGAEELAFERTLLTEVKAPASAAAPSMPAAPPEGAASPREAPWQPAAVAAPAAPAPATPAGADSPPQSVEELARRLQQLTVLGDREGAVAMPIPPDAPIYRLRKGGTALLLARVESEAFLAHQVRRFDVVFALTAAGEVLVFSRLAGRLPELMERAADFQGRTMAG